MFSLKHADVASRPSLANIISIYIHAYHEGQFFKKKKLFFKITSEIDPTQKKIKNRPLTGYVSACKGNFWSARS